MISIESVEMIYGPETDQPTVALRDVNLKVEDHDFVSLIGPSGCGKTTLMKLCDGLLQPTSGVVAIDGTPVKGPGPDRAVVFQDFALLPWATVRDNVAFGLEVKGMDKAERYEIAEAQIERVGLKGFADRLPRQLSGGMQQRVGLARALAVDPDILLMDEPFGALDAQTRALLQEDLLDLWQQNPKTVVFVTHDMEEAVYLSDKIVIMYPRPGRVVEVLETGLPRPRSHDIRRTKEFGEHTMYVWETLRDAVRQQEAEEANA